MREAQTLLLALALSPALYLTSCATTASSAPAPPGDGPAGAPSSSSATSVTPRAALPAPPLDWQAWTPEVFARAAAERRLLLVSVGTTWCHFCHVMDEETWAHDEVRRILAEHFVAVRVDADARPDVAERYEQWAWPATAVLTHDAQPVVEMKGYRTADDVLKLLRGIVDDHLAGRSVARRRPPDPPPPAQDTDLAAVRALAEAQLDRLWDDEQAGWGGPKKYPLLAPVQHALYRATRRGEAIWAERAKRTLAQQAKITDPVWGGMYQYSTRGDWDHPHYEKLAFIQGWAMTMYAEAYRATGEEQLLVTARDTARYVTTILRSDDGGFFANQDADVGSRGDAPHVVGAAFYALDDDARQAAGMPFIDRHVYAEHNGYLIAGLAQLFAVTGERPWLDAAVTAAERVLRTHRVSATGAFRHDESDASGRVYLSDQVAMAEGLLALYEATGDLRFRDEAVVSMRFVRSTLHDEASGAFFAHTLTGTEVGVFAERRRPFELNARAARLLLRLSHSSDLEGVEPWHEEALAALRWMSRPKYLAAQGRAVGDYLLALEDALHEPVHISIVAADDDDAVGPLLEAALRVNAPSRIVERLRPGGRFPDMGEPAAFICGSAYCSRPLFKAEELARAAEPFVVLSPSAPRG